MFNWYKDIPSYRGMYHWALVSRCRAGVIRLGM